jgi:hypothetical protein
VHHLKGSLLFEEFSAELSINITNYKFMLSCISIFAAKAPDVATALGSNHLPH